MPISPWRGAGWAKSVKTVQGRTGKYSSYSRLAARARARARVNQGTQGSSLQGLPMLLSGKIVLICCVKLRRCLK